MKAMQTPMLQGACRREKASHYLLLPAELSLQVSTATA